MLLRLIDNGEERLIGAVERGEIPIAVAMEIASSDDAAIQQSLAEAYTTKQLRGKALLAARRLVEERHAIGKAMRTSGRKEEAGKVTCEKRIVKNRYRRKEIERQKQLA